MHKIVADRSGLEHGRSVWIWKGGGSSAVTLALQAD